MPLMFVSSARLVERSTKIQAAMCSKNKGRILPPNNREIAQAPYSPEMIDSVNGSSKVAAKVIFFRTRIQRIRRLTYSLTESDPIKSKTTSEVIECLSLSSCQRERPIMLSSARKGPNPASPLGGSGRERRDGEGVVR